MGAQLQQLVGNQAGLGQNFNYVNHLLIIHHHYLITVCI